ncbi:MAG: transporter substrate-binding domain-containing protein [Candidatus Desulfatibia sp.]|uniref:substrate-binding periplasmic protein n=1 Tax=Candidatus Desulfatibia sp. TaxID=3101189 RepID=UPI002F2E65BF
MKTRWIFFVALCFAILFPLRMLAAAGEIKLATQREGHRLSAESEPIVRCAMDMINQPFTITKMPPWERAQRGTENGTFDGFFIATKNDKRDSYAVISEPMFTIKWLYVIHKDSEISPDDIDFKNRRFAADIGSARFKWLEDRRKKGEIIKEIISVDSPDQMMKMLVANRIDVAFMNAHGLEKSIENLSLDPDNFKTFIIREIPGGIYFSKAFLRKNSGFLEKFNAALSGCKKQEKRTYTFYIGADSPLKDIIGARLKEAFKRIGLEAKLVHIDSAQRALVLANEEGDGDANRVPNIKEIVPKNTYNLLQIPESTVLLQLFVFSKRHRFPVEGWKSIGKYHNGARIGVKILEKNLPGKRTFLPTLDRLFQMLDAGRLDTVVEWEFIAEKTMRDLNIRGIERLLPPIVKIPGHLYIHKKHRKLIPAVSSALAEMKADGTYDKLKKQVLQQFFGK